MRRSRAEPAERQTERWLPRRDKQGVLTYDVNHWGVEPGREGNTTLCDEAALGVWGILDSRLSEDLRCQLADRGVDLLVFRIGVRGRGWGPSLLREMSETLERTTSHLASQPGPGGGAKVRQQCVVVSCCLAPDQTGAQQILAQLDTLDDNEEGIYHVISLTDETLPRKPPKGQTQTSEDVPHPAERPAAPSHSALLKIDEQLRLAVAETVRAVLAGLPGDPKDRLMALATLNDAFRGVLRTELQTVLDRLLRIDPPEAFTDKQVVAALGNKVLRTLGFAIVNPETGLPAGIVANRPRPTSTSSTLHLQDRAADEDDRRHRSPDTKTLENPLELTEVTREEQFVSLARQRATKKQNHRGG